MWFFSDDMKMNSKYIGYSTGVRCTTFIPCVLGFILFISLIFVYGRFPPNKVRELTFFVRT